MVKDDEFLSEGVKSLGNVHPKDTGISSPDGGFALKRELVLKGLIAVKESEALLCGFCEGGRPRILLFERADLELLRALDCSSHTPGGQA